MLSNRSAGPFCSALISVIAPISRFQSAPSMNSKKGISMIRVAFVIGDYPSDQRRLREDTARSYSSAEVEVGILSVPARPFDGLTPAEIQAAAPLFHEAF